MDFTTVYDEPSSLVVLVATDGSLVVLGDFCHYLAHVVAFALGVDGERGISVDADALLGSVSVQPSFNISFTLPKITMRSS